LASPLIVPETSPLAAAWFGFYGFFSAWVFFQRRLSFPCSPNIAHTRNDKASAHSWGKLSHGKTSSWGTGSRSWDKTTLPPPQPCTAVTRLSGSSAIKLGNMPHFLPDSENILCSRTNRRRYSWLCVWLFTGVCHGTRCSPGRGSLGSVSNQPPGHRWERGSSHPGQTATRPPASQPATAALGLAGKLDEE